MFNVSKASGQATIKLQVSDDNSTWIDAVDVNGNALSFATTASGHRAFNLRANYFRVNVASASSIVATWSIT